MYIDRTEKVNQPITKTQKRRIKRGGKQSDFEEALESVVEVDAVDLSKDVLDDENKNPPQQQQQDKKKDDPAKRPLSIADLDITA